jgi:hypothetical protein
MTTDADRNESWPWDQAPNVAAITVQSVLDGAPILHVSHDEDDDGWQFLDGEPVDMNEARIVAMRTVVRLDSTLVEVADLPPGWTASRERIGEPWTRRPVTAD